MPQENIPPLTASHGEQIVEGFHSFVFAFIPQHEQRNQAKASYKTSDSAYFVTTLQIIKQTTETLLSLRNNHGAISIRLCRQQEKKLLYYENLE